MYSTTGKFFALMEVCLKNRQFADLENIDRCFIIWLNNLKVGCD
jgi:hypothetical protein